MDNGEFDRRLSVTPAYTVCHPPGWAAEAVMAWRQDEDRRIQEFVAALPVELPYSIMAHCSPDVLLDDSPGEVAAREARWARMLADPPSADPPSDHGCRLVNYLAKQERRRNATLTASRRTNREGPEAAPSLLPGSF